LVNGQQTEIVGVTDDARFTVPGRPNLPRLYRNGDQAYSPRAILMVRGPVTNGGIAALLAGAVADLGPDLPLNPVGTLAANVGLAYFPQRLLGGATIGVAGLTLLLAAFGLYGLLAFWVTTRRTELGVRMALGADAASVTGLALRQGLVPIAWGIGAGVVLAVAVGTALRGFLIGVSPFDPVAYLAGGVAFLAVATAACRVTISTEGSPLLASQVALGVG
jgi:putative ABC transport system permease protein